MLTKDVLGNKDMKIEEVEERLNYDNDIFFKFALGTEDEDAAFIRNTIIERVTGIHPKESTVLNPNLDPVILKKKKMVLDIRVKDSEGREYGIEMQTTYSKKSELKRLNCTVPECYRISLITEKSIMSFFLFIKSSFSIPTLNTPGN